MLASRIAASHVAGVSALHRFAARPILKLCQAHMSNSQSSPPQQTDQPHEPSTSGSKFECDIECHLSDEARTRTLSTLSKFIFGFSGIPDMVSFHGGLPPPSIFPFKSLKLETQDGRWLEVPAGDKIDAAQQYNTNGRGYIPLLDWAKQHTQELHQPPAGQEVVITTGSNQAIDMVLACLLNKGEGLLCDEYTYSHLVEAMMGPKGYVPIPVPMDDFGMTPDALEQTLTDMKTKNMPLPRVLYLVPNGQNPVSYVAPLERKQALYQICRNHDLVIVEDDPYFYLQFPFDGELPGLWNLGQSYLALDTDSRVIRLDSFAKFLAPGFRLGWVTAHPTFVDKLTWHMHGTALGPCSTTQVMIAELMEHWGPEGLDKHLHSIQAVYKRRAQLMYTSAQKYLEGLADWLPPQAGMFMWLKLGAGVKDADDIIDTLREEKVGLVPGRISHCLGPRPPFPCPYVRISFAMAPEEDIPKGMQRLANVLKKHQRK